MRTADIRNLLVNKFECGHLAEDGNVEIINANFIADEPSIFGTVNESWTRRELTWYMSKSLKVADIQDPVPQIWGQIASVNGEINSNYGWCIFSRENGNQYDRALQSLIANPMSRQAVMIYIRPSMHDDATRDGMRDFMCTYSVQLLIRDNKLDYIVNMRSNDAVHGYKGDYAWHKFVRDMAYIELSKRVINKTPIEPGNIYWNAGSLHVYPRHFHLIKS